MKSDIFKKNKFASVIVASCALGSNNMANADDSTVLEEVVVTGVRASLERAMDIKRDSAGVVDAISAEDIGKFPDANLAESLQRITGVSIDRVNGEGSQVTVRGFGAADNMVTLNGRTMPAGYTYGGGSGAGGTSGGATRAFDFANLASESVSGVEVYKTGRASVPTGGIGASINVKTLRPLGSAQNRYSATARMLHDTTNNEGSDITPEVSGLASWANEGGTLGLALTASYSERDSSIAGAAENNWNIARWDQAAFEAGQNNLYSWARGQDNEFTATVINPPEDGQLYGRPNDFRWSYSDRHRERTNVQLTGQYAATDDIVITADYTFAESATQEHRGEWTIWFANNSSAKTVIFDGSAVATPIFYQEDLSNKDMGYEQQWREQDNTLSSLGVNIEWQVNDNLSVTLDGHSSSMDNEPAGPEGAGEIAISVGAPIGTKQWVDFSDALPVGDYEWDDSNTNNNGEFDEGDFGTQQGRVFYAAQYMDVDQLRLFGTWELEDKGAFNFGAEHRMVETTQQSSTRQVALGGWGVSNPGELTGQLNIFNMAAPFDDYNMDASFRKGVRAKDVVALCEHTTTLPYGLQEEEWKCAPKDRLTSNNIIEETISGLYIEFKNDFELGGKQSNILAGLRYESTDVESSSNVNPPLYRPWQGDNDFQIDKLAEDARARVDIHSYTNILPSLDFDIRFTNDLVGRFSASQTISRPNFGNMFASVGNFNQSGSTLLSSTPTPTASRGTAALDPLESTNVDLSLEWYFNDASYASVGFFNKDVKNFIGTAQADETHYGMKNPSAGPRAQTAEELLEQMNVDVDNSTLFAMTAILSNPEDFDIDVQPVSEGIYDLSDPNLRSGAMTVYEQKVDELTYDEFYRQLENDYDIVPNENDPLVEWRTSYPVNQRKASIQGAELAVQHFFGDSGFGFQANMTIVDGDVEFDNLADPSESQFALLGLSDTANVVFMYENYGVQARLAYNWRDEFLRQTNQGSSRNPVYVDAYQQWDASIRYEVTDSLNVFFEGLNLLEENVRWHTRSERMTQYLEQLGARYQIGLSYSL